MCVGRDEGVFSTNVPTKSLPEPPAATCCGCPPSPHLHSSPPTHHPIPPLLGVSLRSQRAGSNSPAAPAREGCDRSLNQRSYISSTCLKLYLYSPPHVFDGISQILDTGAMIMLSLGSRTHKHLSELAVAVGVQASPAGSGDYTSNVYMKRYTTKGSFIVMEHGSCAV